MASSPITWQIDGETMETVTDFIPWATKLLQMVTAAMLAPWKKSYNQPRQHIKKQSSLCQQRFVYSTLWCFQYS